MSEFEKVVAKLDRSGNEKAQEFRDALVGLSLTQLSSDAHGIKFEKTERQLYLETRQIKKKSFHPKLTKWLQIDKVQNYGKSVNVFKVTTGLPLKPVEQYDTKELQMFTEYETVYDAFRGIGMSHEKALKALENKIG